MDGVVQLIGTIGVVVTVGLLLYQNRMLRESVDASNYHSMLRGVIDVRAAAISEPNLASIYEMHPSVKKSLDQAGCDIAQFLYILNLLTTWEVFYRQRARGLLDDSGWSSYLEAMQIVATLPLVKAALPRLIDTHQYRNDWSIFLDAILRGETPPDPAAARRTTILGHLRRRSTINHFQ